jgi:cyclophilin family peptidyl-prolyl cis-trans isomerase
LSWNYISANLKTVAFQSENLKCLNKKWFISLFMSSKKNSKVKTYNPRTRDRNRKLIAAAIIAVVAIALVAFVMLDQSGANKASPNQTVNTPSPSPTSTASTSPTSSSSPFPSVTPLTSPAGEYSAGGTKVLFITSKGDIVIQMRDDRPITTANFVKLVKEGYYNDTTFMRVLAGFMIQGGEGKTSEPTIQDEASKGDNVNSNMTIAMANTGQPNSASTQFFINVADNNNLYPSFDTSYTVFGQVIYDQNTVMAISQVPVEYSAVYQENSQPVTPVTLIGAAVMP